jgi:hypothetical protein
MKHILEHRKPNLVAQNITVIFVGLYQHAGERFLS